MKSANQRLLDTGIRHAIYIERLKVGEAERIARYVDRVLIPSIDETLTKRLGVIGSRGYDPGPWTTKRYQDMQRAIRDVADDFEKVLRGDFVPRVYDIAGAEAQWTSQNLSNAFGPVQVDTLTPGIQNLRAAIKAQPYAGAGSKSRNLSQWFRTLKVSAEDETMRAVNLGLSRGDGTEKIIRRVRRNLQTTKTHAQVVARTTVTHATNVAREQTYLENPKIVERVRYVATLDARTTDICAGLDGKTFRPGEGERPPMHPNCRSTTVPVVKPIEEIIGVRRSRKVPPLTRASINGPVSGRENFGKWLKRQPESDRVLTLGRTRAKLFDSGLKIERFTDVDWQKLNLAQIAKRERIDLDLIRRGTKEELSRILSKPIRQRPRPARRRSRSQATT